MTALCLPGVKGLITRTARHIADLSATGRSDPRLRLAKSSAAWTATERLSSTAVLERP